MNALGIVFWHATRIGRASGLLEQGAGCRETLLSSIKAAQNQRMHARRRQRPGRWSGHTRPNEGYPDAAHSSGCYTADSWELPV